MSQTEIMETLALPPYHLRAVQHLMRTEKMSLREILRNAISTDVMYEKQDAVWFASRWDNQHGR